MNCRFYPETLIITNYIKGIWNKYDIYITDNYPRELLTYYLYQDNQRDAFMTNYVWFNNSFAFLDIQEKSKNNVALIEQNGTRNILSASDKKNKGLAFFMFPNYPNEQTIKKLLEIYPDAKKIYLYYKDDNINRPASLVLLVPAK